MKKIMLILIMLSALSSSMFASISIDKFWDIPDESYISLKDSTGFTFVYNRETLSISDNSEAGIKEKLKQKLCSNENYKREINNGLKLNYIFVYKDGAFLIEIDSCEK